MKELSALFLQLIFSQSLEASKLPKGWNLGRVTPIHETGDKNFFQCYSPISLTGVLS